MKCADTCLTCAQSDANSCTSCYGSSKLVGTTCTGCTDPNAATCDGNIAWADTCKNGYSAVNGACVACAAHCLTCAIRGQGKCDDGGCGPGFVVVRNTENCTLCFSGCATCVSNNPSVCQSCPAGLYLTTDSLCVSCATGCVACTSTTACTNCEAGYVLQSGLCYVKKDSPCASQNGDTCASCFSGYNFNTNDNTCSQDTSCNSDNSCITCA